MLPEQNENHHHVSDSYSSTLMTVNSCLLQQHHRDDDHSLPADRRHHRAHYPARRLVLPWRWGAIKAEPAQPETLACHILCCDFLRNRVQRHRQLRKPCSHQPQCQLQPHAVPRHGPGGPQTERPESAAAQRRHRQHDAGVLQEGRVRFFVLFTILGLLDREILPSISDMRGWPECPNVKSWTLKINSR